MDTIKCIQNIKYTQIIIQNNDIENGQEIIGLRNKIRRQIC